MISTAITRGLGGNATNLILGHFRLSKNIVVTPTVWYSGNGGSRAMAPGEIFNFYKPVQQNANVTNFLVPGEDPILTRRFKISVKIQTAKHEFVIHVPQKLNPPAIKVIQIFSKMRIKATIKAISTTVASIKAKLLKD